MREASGLILLILATTVDAAANGWVGGQNFIPVLRPCRAVSTDGQTLELPPGKPVCLEPGSEALETWVYWGNPAREVRIEIDRDALPKELDGFRAYRSGRFADAIPLLVREAEDGPPLARTWRLILAGHASMLMCPKAYSRALWRYRQAAEVPANEFTRTARYFEARALIALDRHEEALGIFDELRMDGDAAIMPGHLFSTEPHGGEVTAWTNIHTAPSRICPALRSLVAHRLAYSQRGEKPSAESRAETIYQLAKATERFWYILPDAYYDNPRPRNVAPLLEHAFKDYPDTAAGERAFYEWFDHQGTSDWEGDEVGRMTDEAREMRTFLDRYPEGALAEKAKARLAAAEAFLTEHAL